MEEQKLFSNGMPFILPVWHFSEQVCKPFSSFKQNADLDCIPDYGGHMLYASPLDSRVEELKRNNLSACPFRPKACLLPYRLQANPSEKICPNKSLDCLMFDRKTSLLISSMGYSASNVRLGFEYFALEETKEDEDACWEFTLPSAYGAIEQLCPPIQVGSQRLICVRQQKSVSLLRFDTPSLEDESQYKRNFTLDRRNELHVQSLDREYMYVSHNHLLPQMLFHCTRKCMEENDTLPSGYRLAEQDIGISGRETWKMECESLPDFKNINQPIMAEYTSFHPRLAYFLDGSQVSLIDFRLKPKKSFTNVMRATTLSTMFEFDRFSRLSQSHLNPNYVMMATDLHLILGDVRYPDRVLLQWNHMLPTDQRNNPICQLKSNALINGKNVFAVSNSNRTALVTISASNAPEMIQPTSLHFPLHLPQFIDSYRFSSVVEGYLESYLNKSKIIGFDFISHEKGFTMFHMSNYGDIYVQDFVESDSQMFNTTKKIIQPAQRNTEAILFNSDDESENDSNEASKQKNEEEEEMDSEEPIEYNYKYHSEVKFDRYLRQYLNQNFANLSEMIFRNLPQHFTCNNSLSENYITKKDSWLKYLDENTRKHIGKRDEVDRKLSNDELQKSNPRPKGLEGLIDLMKTNTKIDVNNNIVLKNMKKLFDREVASDEIASSNINSDLQKEDLNAPKDLLKYRWSSYSYKLIKAWKLPEFNVDSEDLYKRNQEDLDLQALSQYI